MTATVEQVRDEANEWFRANWDESLPLGEWWARLAQSGWGFPSWPIEHFGRGLTGALAKEAIAARSAAGAFGPPSGISTFLTAPTLLTYGTADQKARFMTGIAAGTEVWCQLFSEPGAGSDMAGLQMRAERDGDEWVMNGQKVWNSGAQFAKYGILIARTDPDVPKHRGITFFLIDMDQPGVEVRPLREMTGEAAFNEVFLTGARVPDSNRLGDLGDGWRVAMTTLSHERDPNNAGMVGDGGSSFGKPDLSLTVAEYKAGQASTTDSFSFSIGGGVGKLFERIVADHGATDDAVRRQQIIAVHVQRQLMRLTARRSTAALKAGRQPGPEISTLKLMGSEVGRKIRDTGWAAMGPHGTLFGEDAPHDGKFHGYGLFTPSGSIAGGTDEVQRNIIGERVLGLPKEPDDSRDKPFRELRVGTQT